MGFSGHFTHLFSLAAGCLESSDFETNLVYTVALVTSTEKRKPAAKLLQTSVT